MALNNSSLSFNGSTQYGKLSTAASIRNLGSFAFLAWFKVGTNSVRTNQHAYVERQGTGTGIRFRFTPVKGKLQFGFSAVDGTADTSYTYNTKWDDRWHLAGFSARLGGEKPTYEIILDAVVVASGTLIVPRSADPEDAATATESTISDTAPLGIYVGNHSRAKTGESFPSTTAWHGLLDDVIIFNSSIGQAEVNAYYTSNDFWNKKNTPAEDFDENRIFNWTFDENAGSITRDNLSSARTGTLYTGSSASSALWTPDRPYLGEGLKDTTVPTTPTSNAPTSITATSFNASWTTSTDNVWVQFYELQVSEFADFSSYSAFDMGRATSKTVTGLIPANNYYWRVRAFDAALNASLYSGVRSLTTLTIGDVTPPSPPTNLSATYVTHSSFRLNFVASVSNDAVGYKVDIATDADFKRYLSDYTNQDIGNSTVLDVFGVKPLSSYFIRVRSYDATDNESNDSLVLRVNTPRQPDITPPLPAVMQNATGITSKEAILHWDEGVDDVGVAGYYVDISTNPLFSDRVLAAGLYWDDLDVGNVTSYRVTGLEPEKAYFYRVRAYDEAGNVAAPLSEGFEFMTSPSTMFEGGYISSIVFSNEFAEVDSAYPTSPTATEFGELTIENTGTTQKLAYLGFSFDSVVGSLESGILSFYPSATGPITIRAAQMEMPEGMTYNTRPVFTGDSIEVNILEPNQWIEVDISSLLGSMNDYVVELSTTQVTPITIYLGNLPDLEFRPYASLENDPLASTQPLPLDIEILRSARINTAINPSFETSLDGWTTVGSTITRVSGGTDGSWCLSCTGSTIGQGVKNANVDYMSPVESGELFTYSCDLRSLNGTANMQLQVQGMTETAFVDSRLTQTKNIVAGTDWSNQYITFIVPEGVTHARLQVTHDDTTEFTFEMDNVLYEQSALPGISFNGNTPGAVWTGVVNNSFSRMDAPTVFLHSPFVGDSNHNNSAKAYFRHDSETGGWIPAFKTPIVDRTLNTYDIAFEPSLRKYNLVVNPSFEVDTQGEWESTEGSGIIDSDGYTGTHAYSAYYYLRCLKNIPVVAGQTYTLQARIKPDEEVSVTSFVSFSNSTSSLANENNTTYVYGDGVEWSLLTQTVTVPPTATKMSFTFRSDNVEDHFLVDSVQVNDGSIAYPYRDGDTLDGKWEGEAHHSTTGIQMLNNQVYSFMLEYADPEGFFDTTDALTYQHIISFAIPDPPDEAFTALPLELTATETSVNAILPYLGDDNDNSLVRFEFKRTDLTVWSEVRPAYIRKEKKILASIPNLRAGTNYTVRAFITDPDGVHGAEGSLVISSVTTSYNTNIITAEPHISFGGFVLMGRGDKKIATTYHNAFGFPERRVQIDDLPRLEGAVERQSLWGKKTINLRGFVSGDSRADLDEVQGALKRALAPKLQRLVIDTLSQRGRFYYATCSDLHIEESGDQNISHLEWNASFQCADPFAYDIIETTLPTFTSPNNGIVSVTNTGDSSIQPYIRISTPSHYPVAVTVVNKSTGERIAPKISIIRGDRLVIDSERRSLTKNDVEIDYAGAFPSLAVGGNEFSFSLAISRTATSSGSVQATLPAPTINVDMRWRHKYL